MDPEVLGIHPLNESVHLGSMVDEKQEKRIEWGQFCLRTIYMQLFLPYLKRSIRDLSCLI